MRYFYNDDLLLSEQEQQRLKIIRLVLGYALEDLGQNVIQYFYKEKYLLQADPFIFIKALITLTSSSFAVYKLSCGCVAHFFMHHFWCILISTTNSVILKIENHKSTILTKSSTKYESFGLLCDFHGFDFVFYAFSTHRWNSGADPSWWQSSWQRLFQWFVR